MDIFILSKRRHICYNSSDPQKRDESIFDRGGRQTAPAAGPKPGSCVPRDRIGRAACPHAAASTAEGKTLGGARVPRARLPKELRKRIRRPQHVRNISVLGFVAKPLTLHNEKPNTMVRRVAITRRTLLSCFSLRFLAAPATRRDFEGAPLFFSAP